MAVFQDGRIVFANPAFAEITGYSVLEIMQATTAQIAEVIHPDDRETVLRNMAERLEGAAIPANYSCRMIRKKRRNLLGGNHFPVIEIRGKTTIRFLYLDITHGSVCRSEKHLLEEQLRLPEDGSDGPARRRRRPRF
jgi:PAS domain S-box-containing protein